MFFTWGPGNVFSSWMSTPLISSSPPTCSPFPSMLHCRTSSYSDVNGPGQSWVVCTCCRCCAIDGGRTAWPASFSLVPSDLAAVASCRLGHQHLLGLHGLVKLTSCQLELLVDWHDENWHVHVLGHRDCRAPWQGGHAGGRRGTDQDVGLTCRVGRQVVSVGRGAGQGTGSVQGLHDGGSMGGSGYWVCPGPQWRW